MLRFCWLFAKADLVQHTKVYEVVSVMLAVLIVATKEIGLEVNADKTKYMVMS